MRRVVDQDTWARAHRDFLQKEKALQRQRDALAAERRDLPWVRVERDYRFDGSDGPCTLHDLFDGRSQLLVWHFMFGPSWDAGCPSCSLWADQYAPAAVHLAARDVSLVVVSAAPIETLDAYRTRMGWDFRWVSAGDSGFNTDFAVSFPAEAIARAEPDYNHGTLAPMAEELPGLSVFAREGGVIYRTYSTYARGLDALNGVYQQLDLVPKGRDEAALDYPMAWVRRHDEYTP
ncbi:MAG: DUF899 domain-containing protein [Pseudomonadota bacterium]